jgi:two-component system, NarL family, sensor histidine kinase UhpB
MIFGRSCTFALLLCFALWTTLMPAHAADVAPVQTITAALAAHSDAERFPVEAGASSVGLPDDWAESRPRYDGSVWYRVQFERSPASATEELQALYIERVCSTAEAFLNGHRVFSGGRMSEPYARNCYTPQLVALPAALLKPDTNVLDVHVKGHAVGRVAARQRGGGLSALQVGPWASLTETYEDQLFWNVRLVQITGIVLTVIGALLAALGWLNRREAYLGYFGWTALGMAALSTRLWIVDLPLDNGVVEVLVCTGFAVVAGLGVQFFLSFSGLRSRDIEIALLAQVLLVPLTLWVVGSGRTFAVAGLWYSLLAGEGLAAMALHLHVCWRDRRNDFWPMLLILVGIGGLVLGEMAVQHDLLPAPKLALFHFSVPLLFIAIGVRLLQLFARAVQAAEAGRNGMEARVQEITVEIERNFAQLAELRVEQVTEKERKRIAGDLHDDLGAKLLTIVHTSESERISSLAREALEEMRLSVRGLTGKPMKLADALADWRAETVSRLGQANVEIDWRSPAEEVEQLLPARSFVQTTRILREAVSNIIKHSGASHCKVRCAVHQNQFGLNIQDNGKGIPMELDGKLDRGHGMSSMKHRAKQMQGQCLVESGPGYGTVIRLTLPL